eukprot:CAMPEP_0185186530 /NCGR_PEP_ID=MMETSP1140-20130426/4120_1 /TAXON_ID=298111 /ORGANISM="Pavlova sp., Strain CCMP459" /LENGTH=94 /DNA_ID=CAMNT_0027752833 /DNA_START=291 /DNA_END=575 /DNA_ORIENTATION=+
MGLTSGQHGAHASMAPQQTGSGCGHQHLVLGLRLSVSPPTGSGPESAGPAGARWLRPVSSQLALTGAGILICCRLRRDNPQCALCRDHYALRLT